MGTISVNNLGKAYKQYPNRWGRLLEWVTVFSIYRKLARGVAPGVADSMHLHHVIYKRLVRAVFDHDEAKMLLSRNNRTTPYLLALMMFTVVPAMIFWSNTPALIGFCALFAVTYVVLYVVLVKFKIPGWLRLRTK